MEPPIFPAGPFEPQTDVTADSRDALIATIEHAPIVLRDAIKGLTSTQLDTLYRNWSIRQIVHHIADSHVNSYIRFKWALTEDSPTIKAYDEGAWASLADARTGAIDAPLALLDGLHMRWAHLLRSMTDAQFARTFVHPATSNRTSLDEALQSYAWHGQHHTAQILWLRSNDRVKNS